MTLVPIDEWRADFQHLDCHPADDTRVYGAVYRIAPPDMAAVTRQLDHRERDGYCADTVAVTLADGSVVQACLYLALTSNPSFVGPQTCAQMARTIAACSGEAGPNTEYLYQLVRAHQAITTTPDTHLFDLEQQTLYFSSEAARAINSSSDSLPS